jgi:hypothetical protein
MGSVKQNYYEFSLNKEICDNNLENKITADMASNIMLDAIRNRFEQCMDDIDAVKMAVSKCVGKLVA